MSVELNLRDRGSMGAARRRISLMSTIFRGAPREVVQASARVYKRELKRHAPRSDKSSTRQGTLQRSIIYRTFPIGESWGARFYAIAYAVFVITGTRPHVIQARIKKALYWEGAPHPFVRVNHPGTRPNDFREPAAEAAYPEIVVILRAAGIKVVEESKL